MKKIALSLAGVLAAAAFAPEASAVPAFARQTGMACTACHFQHFPVLNSFGRSFKSSGYTLQGTQANIEGENLSVPSNLNAAIFINAQYNKTNGPTTNVTAPNGTVNTVGATTANSKSTNNGAFQVPQAMSLFMGGRIAENAGFITELTLLGPAGIAAFKMPFMFDVAGAKVGVVPFSTDGLGVAHSFELMNTGAVAVHEFNQADLPALSAQAYINTTGAAPAAATAAQPAGNSPSAASGLAFVASGDMGFINFAKWTPSHVAQGANGAPTSNYIRAAWLGDVKGWDVGVGIQSWSGVSTTATGGVGANAANIFAAGVPGATVDTKASAIDAQMMGEVNDMPLTIVASWAKAPKGTVARANQFNGSTTGDRTSFNIGAELGVIPHKATLQLALRQAKSGSNVVNQNGIAIANTNATDNAIMVGATYELAQNVKFVLTQSMYSGDTYNSGAPFAAVTGTPYNGNSSTWLQLESAF